MPYVSPISPPARVMLGCRMSTARTRFIPDRLLTLFEKISWPLAAAGTAARTASSGPRIDVGARMRGMWR